MRSRLVIRPSVVPRCHPGAAAWCRARRVGRANRSGCPGSARRTGRAAQRFAGCRPGKQDRLRPGLRQRPDRAAPTRPSRDEVYCIGSISKQSTATAILCGRAREAGAPHRASARSARRATFPSWGTTSGAAWWDERFGLRFAAREVLIRSYELPDGKWEQFQLANWTHKHGATFQLAIVEQAAPRVRNERPSRAAGVPLYRHRRKAHCPDFAAWHLAQLPFISNDLPSAW